jgi:hypothetical protein
MLLADPFVVHILLSRVLQELSLGVLGGNTLPSSSRLYCKLRTWHDGLPKSVRFGVPPAGFDLDDDSAADPTARIPYSSLRRCLPVLVQLLLEADLDKCTAPEVICIWQRKKHS